MAFCFLFVTIFSILLGNENSIVGVVVLLCQMCIRDRFGASDKTLPYGVSYARIYILGSIFVLIVMGMNPFITTQGFAKISICLLYTSHTVQQ